MAMTTQALDAITAFIEEHAEEALVELERYCTYQSVAAQRRAIPETAVYVQELLQAAGFSTRIEPKLAPGHPVVLAERRGRSDRTLLFYNHYDVQPEDPLDLWTTPPYVPHRE